MSRPASLSTSFIASAALHAFAIGLLLTMVAPPPLHPPLVFPVSLVTRSGGGGGGEPAAAPAPAPAAEPAPAEAAPPAPVAKPVRPRPVARPHPPSAADAAPATVATGGSGTGDATTTGDGAGGRGDGAGGGEGGGDGSGGARVAYGTNPLPPYPLVARRLGKEGVVLLEVLVAPDGHAAEVRVLRSCGFPPLDDSAMTTVRDRWRFIPARRGSTPVESRVTVPIRFRLDGTADDGDARG